MAKSDKTRAAGIAAVVTLLAEGYGRQATETTFRAYITGLEGLTVEQIEIGVNRALRTCKFMPTPSELRELSGELKPEDRAQQAWLAVGEAMSRHGGYRTVTFDDVVINAAVRSVGGWERICETDPKELEAHTRREFLKAYASLCLSGVGEEQSAPLIGIFDRQNAVKGYAAQDVRVIETGLPPLPGAPRLAGKSVPRISESQQ